MNVVGPYLTICYIPLSLHGSPKKPAILAKQQLDPIWVCLFAHKVSGCEKQELIEIGKKNKNEYVPTKAVHGIKQLHNNFSLEAMRDDDIALNIWPSQFQLLSTSYCTQKLPKFHLMSWKMTRQIWWLTAARRKTATEQKIPISLPFLYFFQLYWVFKYII